MAGKDARRCQSCATPFKDGLERLDKGHPPVALFLLLGWATEDDGTCGNRRQAGGQTTLGLGDWGETE